jgi:hypothetical protein
MASIPIQITGVLTYSGLEVGGGPAPGGPFPSHPIAPGGPPPGTWGGVRPPYIDIGLPGPQPPDGSPPGFWGGSSPWPGWATPPIAPGGPPPWVSHPIPPTVWPEPPVVGGGTPPGFWGGSSPWPGYATPPIVLPILPGGGLPEAGTMIEWKTAWSPQTGWVVMGLPQVPHPTPSAGP